MTAIHPETFRHAGRLEKIPPTNDFEADGGGAPSHVCDLWCSITPATPEEKTEAAERKIVLTHKLRTHWRPELFFPGDHTFRVIVGQRMFHVRGVVDVEERRRVAELTCTEKS